MKLLVLGATGGTGILVVKEALKRDHEVVALVRSPEKITVQNDKLKVVKGDVTSKADLLEHVAGCDAVIGCLGGKPGLFTSCDIYSTPIKSLASAMKEAGVERLVCVTAWGTKDHPGLPFVWRYVLKPSMLKQVVLDMERMEDFLLTEESAHINYTVVRPPRLTNTASTGKEIQKMEGQLVEGASNVICREDLAIFILDCLATKDWDRKMVAVAGPKESS